MSDQTKPAPLATPTRKRRGSETRQKQYRITYRVSEADYRNIEASASRSGLTVASYSRARAADAPTTRPRKRAPVDLTALATVLREFTRFAVNFNQLTRHANMGGIVMPEELVALAIRIDANRAQIMTLMGRT